MTQAWRIIEGDCIAAMAAMPEASVDAVVCDPPYALSFMGKGWDSFGSRVEAGSRGGSGDKGVLPGYGRGGTSADRFAHRQREARAFQAWCEAWATEALRVLKPGGHLLAFGGTRTYHRLTCAIEDAGFEIRDCLAWMYGSGFPKSLDVSKAIDKAAGAEREIVGPPRGIGGRNPEAHAPHENYGGLTGRWAASETAPATPDAARWQGWGTALKPAHEPIVLARKPLTGTVAGNVLAHGTGALNVDGCRIDTDWSSDPTRRGWQGTRRPDDGFVPGSGGDMPHAERSHTPDTAPGRWPANVLLDQDAAAMLDEQTGELTSASGKPFTRHADSDGRSAFGTFEGGEAPGFYGDTGGASRFFYVAKASSAERNAGLDGFEEKPAPASSGNRLERMGSLSGPRANVHPTVKPIDMMRWLCRLVTPPGGVVLDPFTGSGTTGCAAVLEGFRFVGIEREAEYADIAEARIRWWAAHPEGMTLVKRLDAERERKAATARGQDSLFDLGEAA